MIEADYDLYLCSRNGAKVGNVMLRPGEGCELLRIPRSLEIEIKIYGSDTVSKFSVDSLLRGNNTSEFFTVVEGVSYLCKAKEDSSRIMIFIDGRVEEDQPSGIDPSSQHLNLNPFNEEDISIKTPFFVSQFGFQEEFDTIPEITYRTKLYQVIISETNLAFSEWTEEKPLHPTTIFVRFMSGIKRKLLDLEEFDYPPNLNVRFDKEDKEVLKSAYFTIFHESYLFMKGQCGQSINLAALITRDVLSDWQGCLETMHSRFPSKPDLDFIIKNLDSLFSLQIRSRYFNHQDSLQLRKEFWSWLLSSVDDSAELISLKDFWNSAGKIDGTALLNSLLKLPLAELSITLTTLPVFKSIFAELSDFDDLEGEFQNRLNLQANNIFDEVINLLKRDDFTEFGVPAVDKVQLIKLKIFAEWCKIRKEEKLKKVKESYTLSYWEVSKSDYLTTIEDLIFINNKFKGEDFRLIVDNKEILAHHSEPGNYLQDLMLIILKHARNEPASFGERLSTYLKSISDSPLFTKDILPLLIKLIIETTDKSNIEEFKQLIKCRKGLPPDFAKELSQQLEMQQEFIRTVAAADYDARTAYRRSFKEWTLNPLQPRPSTFPESWVSLLCKYYYGLLQEDLVDISKTWPFAGAILEIRQFISEQCQEDKLEQQFVLTLDGEIKVIDSSKLKFIDVMKGIDDKAYTTFEKLTKKFRDSVKNSQISLESFRKTKEEIKKLSKVDPSNHVLKLIRDNLKAFDENYGMAKKTSDIKKKDFDQLQQTFQKNNTSAENINALLKSFSELNPDLCKLFLQHRKDETSKINSLDTLSQTMKSFKDTTFKQEILTTLDINILAKGDTPDHYHKTITSLTTITPLSPTEQTTLLHRMLFPIISTQVKKVDDVLKALPKKVELFNEFEEGNAEAYFKNEVGRKLVAMFCAIGEEKFKSLFAGFNKNVVQVVETIRQKGDNVISGLEDVEEFSKRLDAASKGSKDGELEMQFITIALEASSEWSLPPKFESADPLPELRQTTSMDNTTATKDVDILIESLKVLSNRRNEIETKLSSVQKTMERGNILLKDIKSNGIVFHISTDGELQYSMNRGSIDKLEFFDLAEIKDFSKDRNWANIKELVDELSNLRENLLELKNEGVIENKLQNLEEVLKGSDPKIGTNLKGLQIVSNERNNSNPGCSAPAGVLLTVDKKDLENLKKSTLYNVTNKVKESVIKITELKSSTMDARVGCLTSEQKRAFIDMLQKKIIVPEAFEVLNEYIPHWGDKAKTEFEKYIEGKSQQGASSSDSQNSIKRLEELTFQLNEALKQTSNEVKIIKDITENNNLTRSNSSTSDDDSNTSDPTRNPNKYTIAANPFEGDNTTLNHITLKIGKDSKLPMTLSYLMENFPKKVLSPFQILYCSETTTKEEVKNFIIRYQIDNVKDPKLGDYKSYFILRLQLLQKDIEKECSTLVKNAAMVKSIDNPQSKIYVLEEVSAEHNSSDGAITHYEPNLKFELLDFQMNLKLYTSDLSGSGKTTKIVAGIEKMCGVKSIKDIDNSQLGRVSIEAGMTLEEIKLAFERASKSKIIYIKLESVLDDYRLGEALGRLFFDLFMFKKINEVSILFKTLETIFLEIDCNDKDRILEYIPVLQLLLSKAASLPPNITITNIPAERVDSEQKTEIDKPTILKYLGLKEESDLTKSFMSDFVGSSKFDIDNIKKKRFKEQLKNSLAAKKEEANFITILEFARFLKDCYFMWNAFSKDEITNLTKNKVEAAVAGTSLFLAKYSNRLANAQLKKDQQGKFDYKNFDEQLALFNTFLEEKVDKQYILVSGSKAANRPSTAVAFNSAAKDCLKTCQLIDVGQTGKSEMEKTYIDNLKNIFTKVILDFDQNLLMTACQNYIPNPDLIFKVCSIVTIARCQRPLVILRGESAAGKTSLVKWLAKLVKIKFSSNIKSVAGDIATENILKIHPGLTRREIIERIHQINSSVMEDEKSTPYWSYWVLVDEFNTSQLQKTLLNIMIDREYRFEEVDYRLHDKIFFLATCNPYAESKEVKESSRVIEDLKPLCHRVEPTNVKAHPWIVDFFQLDKNSFKFTFNNLVKKRKRMISAEDSEKLFKEGVLDKLASSDKIGSFNQDVVIDIFLEIRKQKNSSSLTLRDLMRLIDTYVWIAVILNRYVEFGKGGNNLPSEHIEQLMNQCEEMQSKQPIILLALYTAIHICLGFRFCYTKTNLAIALTEMNNIKEIYRLLYAEDSKFKSQVPSLFENLLYFISENIINFGKELVDKTWAEKEREVIMTTSIKQNVLTQATAVCTKNHCFIYGKAGTAKTKSITIFRKILEKVSKTDNFEQLFADGVVPNGLSHFKLIFEMLKEAGKFEFKTYAGSKLSKPKTIDKLFSDIMRLKQQPGEYIVLIIDELGLAEASKENALKSLNHYLEEVRGSEDSSTIKAIVFGLSNTPLSDSIMNRTITVKRLFSESEVWEIIQLKSDVRPTEKLDLILWYFGKTYVKYQNEICSERIGRDYLIHEYRDVYSAVSHIKNSRKDLHSDIKKLRLLLKDVLEEDMSGIWYTHRAEYRNALYFDSSNPINKVFNDHANITSYKDYKEKIGGVYQQVIKSSNQESNEIIEDSSQLFKRILLSDEDAVKVLFPGKSREELCADVELKEFVQKKTVQEIVKLNAKNNYARYPLIKTESETTDLMVIELFEASRPKESTFDIILANTHESMSSKDYLAFIVNKVISESCVVIKNNSQFNDVLYDLVNQKSHLVGQEVNNFNCYLFLEDTAQKVTVPSKLKLVVLFDETGEKPNEAFLSRFQKMSARLSDFLVTEDFKRLIQKRDEIAKIAMHDGKAVFYGLSISMLLSILFTQVKNSEGDALKFELSSNEVIMERLHKLMPRDFGAILAQDDGSPKQQDELYLSKHYFNKTHANQNSLKDVLLNQTKSTFLYTAELEGSIISLLDEELSTHLSTNKSMKPYLSLTSRKAEYDFQEEFNKLIENCKEINGMKTVIIVATVTISSHIKHILDKQRKKDNVDKVRIIVIIRWTGEYEKKEHQYFDSPAAYWKDWDCIALESIK